MPIRSKILVTGASGMLGRVLCRQLVPFYEVVGISKTGREGTIACDISNAPALSSFFEANKPDLVINLAAYSDVDGCERDPKLAHDSNSLAVKYLADICGRRGVPLIHVSTDYVFDGRRKMPYTEADPTGPVNIYGLTKLEGEFYASRCQSSSVIVRTSWLFGPGNPANFVNAITACLRKESAVEVLDDQIDAPTGAADLSMAIQKIIERLLSLKGKKAACEIYHICNSGSTTRYDMTVKIKEILGLKQVKVLKAGRDSIKGRLAVRPAYVVMSNRHFEKTFGVTLRPWEESLREYLLR